MTSAGVAALRSGVVLRRWLLASVASAVVLALGCTRDDNGAIDEHGRGPPDSAVVVALPWRDSVVSAADLESGRLDASWRDVVQLDTTAAADAGVDGEQWEEISVRAVNASPMRLPLYGDVSGPSVLRLQILLDRASFSPGIIDGRWGKNTEKAVYWLQQREGLRATGRVDSATFARLRQLARPPAELLQRRVLTESDVAGPFVQLPQDIYDQAKLDCSCYESLAEKLGERFHAAPDLLAWLNSGIALNDAAAGDTVWVPAVREPDARPAGEVRAIVVSVRGHYLHGYDARGRLVAHFPTTLGSSYRPSHDDVYTITSITENPWWLMQPRLLHTGDPTRPDVKIPPGPNNAVGIMWMALSKPHYGIHGTSAPETIGYATSSGCVRLTNWDALFLSRGVRRGVTVRFRDIPPGGAAEPHGPAAGR